MGTTRNQGFPSVINGQRPPRRGVLTGIPASILNKLDLATASFEDWVGTEGVTNFSGQQAYQLAATSGASYTHTYPAPSSGDTVTRGISKLNLAADPVSSKGVFRQQNANSIAADGFGGAPGYMFAHRFAMASLVPGGTNYEVSAGGLVSIASSNSNNYADGIHVFYDRTLGVASWVIRIARDGVRVDIDLDTAWDNAYHVMGFFHDGTTVFGFVDGVVKGSYAGAEVQPNATVRPVSYHLKSESAGVDDGDIESDWVLHGRAQ